MKNIFANLSNQTQGIFLIIGGSLLVLNSFGFIELLNSVVAVGGLIMIIAGVMMAKLHEKIYVLIGKSNKSDDDNEPMDPDRGF